MINDANSFYFENQNRIYWATAGHKSILVGVIYIRLFYNKLHFKH